MLPRQAVGSASNQKELRGLQSQLKGLGWLGGPQSPGKGIETKARITEHFSISVETLNHLTIRTTTNKLTNKQTNNRIILYNNPTNILEHSNLARNSHEKKSRLALFSSEEKLDLKLNV